ncbi:immune inhibitor A domain-containing protein [Nocardioides sp. W7]|uniref:immune inhibitor A domain-containing protein n=1 Tax=Nocardioides sp. W7 TaxID=2931390 RepID=UPI001FD25610|nr:immune inhibitor A domain-containing protein [Nocardioides sp. W7]
MAAPTTAQATAQPDPRLDDLPPTAGEPETRPDNFPDPLARKRTALRQRAVDDLVAGKARTVGKGRDRTIRMADGSEVEYPVKQTSQLLTFLVEFGDGEGNPDFPDNTAGPLHNDIPEPTRSDNTTYWKRDFSRQHFLDMFFNGLADQAGESFRDVYDEMSNGRFDLRGDVSDWVRVEHPASFYQELQDADDDPETPETGEETGQKMTSFLQDSADAWYDAQVAGGRTDAQIQEYLKTFDVWDRYDFDGDTNFNEADGYIDHFQAIHAGEGEEAGADTWAIWSHRSAVNQNADAGPTGNENGGVQIGSTGLWIRDYTTEPENGGLGVFAHEFGHDLGLPDYYDTQGGDNSTAFWSLMSSGSWLGHGKGTTGTTPNHMGATEKLFLGWYGDNKEELAIVDGTAGAQTITLGPSYHATKEGKQAVAVNLPKGSSTVEVVEPDQGTHYFYSGNGDDRVATVTSPTVTVPATDPTLTARVSYSIEDDWDYAHAKVSTDGGANWTYLQTNLSTTDDPNQQNAGFGITGCSGTRDGDGVCDNAWTDLSADLTAYAGQPVKVEFEMFNDAAYHELGFSVDSIAIGDTVLTNVEDGAPTWTLKGFQVMDGPSYTKSYDRYYLAENRQYQGYDKTLAEGPYSADYPVTAPNKVDQFPYQDGLLVWYANGLYTDNNTSAHPGGGQALPVDASSKYVRWQKNGVDVAAANGRLNAYDATFDVDQTDALRLTNESLGGVTYDVPARPGNPVFDDSDVNGYWDSSAAPASWFSTQVAGVGTMIQVLSSDERTGRMVIKAGRRFAAATAPAQITGTARVGRTLGVTPATWAVTGTSTFTWTVGGKAAGTGSSYVLKPSDSGKTVTVTETRTATGYDSGTSISAPTAKVRAAAVKLTVRAPKAVKRNRSATAKVAVTSPGLKPTGRIKVTYAGKSLRAKALRNGRVRIALPRQSRTSTVRLVVRYEGGTGFPDARTVKTVRIVR